MLRRALSRTIRAVGARALAQGAGYAVAEAGVSGLAIISTTLVARSLSTSAFGSVAFAFSILMFAAIFFDFGLFLPAARLAAGQSGEARSRLIGSALVAFVPIGALFCGLVVALSFVVDGWFHVDSGAALRAVAPLAFVFPLQVFAPYLAQGVDRLHVYSVSAVVAQALYVLALVVVVLVAGVSLTITLALSLRVIAQACAWSLLVRWVRPRFRGALEGIRTLARHARDYGFEVYIGRVLSTGTYSMDVLMVGAFTDARSVGFYTLAGSAAYAVGLPIAGLSAALFGRMTREGEIDRRWLALAWVTGLAGAAAAALAARPLIPIVFGTRYRPAVELVLPLALAAAVRGATTIYNSFLAARGRGRELRNTGLVLTGSNLVFNFALIPPFGALGAAWASLLALVCNYLAHVFFYRRSLAAPAPALGVASR